MIAILPGLPTQASALWPMLHVAHFSCNLPLAQVIEIVRMRNRQKKTNKEKTNVRATEIYWSKNVMHNSAVLN